MEIRVFRAVSISAFLIAVAMIAIDHESTWYYVGAAAGFGLAALLLWRVDGDFLALNRRDTFPEGTTNGQGFGDPATQSSTPPELEGLPPNRTSPW